MILRKITIFMFIIINLILSGCVTSINNSNNFIIDPQQAAKINKLNTWTLHGKISWHDQKNNQAVMCYIKWIKNYNKYYITINGAMNIKSINLEIENGKIKIIDNNNLKQEDIKNILNNISVNMDNLNYWLLGAPNPKYVYRLIKNGFVQQQSYVQYLYYNLYNDLALPRTIIINHNYLNIKIIINNFILLG